MALMHEENATRINWFLQLRKIIRFPKAFLAPHRPAFRRLPRIRGTFSTDHSDPATVRESTYFSAPTKRILPVDGPERSRWARLDATNLLTELPGKARLAAMQSPRAVKTIELVKDAKATLAHSRNGSIYPAPQRLVRASTSDLQPPLPSPSAMNGDLERPQKHASNSKVLRFHPPAYMASQARPNSPRSRQKGGDTLVRAEPPPMDYPSDVGKPSDEKRQPNRFAAEERDEHVSPSRASTQAVTVHIDGSALGRWAIQHLERVLGKPATGMTGVDPRSSPPASCVSPF